MKLSKRRLSNLFRCEIKIDDIYLRNQCKIMNNSIQPSDHNCLTMTRTIKITYKPIETLKRVATSHFHQECPYQASQPAGFSPLRTTLAARISLAHHKSHKLPPLQHPTIPNCTNWSFHQSQNLENYILRFSFFFHPHAHIMGSYQVFF